MWFVPFVFLALLLATNEKTALDGEKSDQQTAASYPQEEADQDRLAEKKGPREPDHEDEEEAHFGG